MVIREPKGMPCWQERRIVGCIAEIIVEEMFKELGFYVLKFGKEYTLEPITQLEPFLKKFKVDFNLEKEYQDNSLPVNRIRNMPDFVIINKKGEVYFLEVKFRRNGVLFPKDKDFFDHFENAFMVVVNLEVSDEIVDIKEEIDESLKNSRFHLWKVDDLENRELGVCYLEKSLKTNLDIGPKEIDKIIKKYEKLVIKWLRTALNN